MKIPTKGLYTIPGASIYVRVVKLHYADGVKAKVKLMLECKNGAVIETKNYTLTLAQIQHWIKLTHVQY